MGKEAVFTMKLEPELRDAFMAAAQASIARPRRSCASSCAILSSRTREYDDFFSARWNARVSICSRAAHTDEEVAKDDFAASAKACEAA